MSLTKEVVVQRLAERKLAMQPITDPPSNHIALWVCEHTAPGIIAVQTSGVAPRKGGIVPQEFTGKLGLCRDQVLPDIAKQASIHCALTLLWVIDQACQGNWNRLLGLLRLDVFVNHSDPNAQDHAAIADPASELLNYALQEKGRHARTTIGAHSLPHDAVLEMALRFQMDSR